MNGPDPAAVQATFSSVAPRYDLANHWHVPALRLASVSTVQGKFDSVKSYLEEAKERNASAVSLASGYAELYSLRNNLVAATETLKFLTRSKEADFQMLTAKGIVELKKGESANARDTFIEATAIEKITQELTLSWPFLTYTQVSQK